MLEWAFLLENRVHMSNQQHALAAVSRIGTWMLGNQCACALYFVHRDPPHFESQSLKLKHQNPPNGTDTLEVLGPAIDLD